MAVIDSRPDAAGSREPPGAVPEESAAPPDDAQTPERVRSLFQMVGSVVAPTTLLTALLIYFGWAYSAAFVAYFGLDISLMGFTTQDYVTSSVQVLFVPMAVAFSAGMLIAWFHARLKARVFVGPDARQRLRWGARAAGSCGLVLFGIGMAGMVVVGRPTRYNLLFPLSFGSGAVLLAYASRLHARSERFVSHATAARSTALLEVTGAFFIVALSLFWAATNYAHDIGTAKAQEFVNLAPRDGSEVVLYSKEPLYLDSRGILETSCGEPAGGYRFRYEGLRLMIRSAGHYYLLPATWSRTGGMAIVVPESDAVRLQFAGPERTDRLQPASPAIACPSPRPPP